MKFLISCAKIISVLLAIIGLSFIIPILVALYYGEISLLQSFILPLIISIVLFLCVFFPTRKFKFTLSIRQTFAIVALCWIFASLLGALPLYLSKSFPNFVDALFESVSGFSTTGATICVSVEDLPNSINMWRALTHWLGGMGIVTLTVALLPLLGIGGFQLIKAESTGPEKGKVTTRITTTAKVLWLIYLSFTLLEVILLKICGMSFLDSLVHSFSTLGTGGFSNKNASIGFYNSKSIEFVISVFMLLSAVNFSLYYYFVIKKISDIGSNSELKFFLLIVCVNVIVLALCLISEYTSFFKSLRYSVFQVASIISTTGFASTDFSLWNNSALFVLFLLFFVGGCSGSTSGGFKVIRWLILGKQIKNEVNKTLHPHGVFTLRLNGKVCKDDVVFSVSGFFFIYFMLIAITTFFGTFANLDFFSSFSVSASMIGNVGPTFGSLSSIQNISNLPSLLKLWYCFIMLAGRLELYTMVIFFFPSYWKK